MNRIYFVTTNNSKFESLYSLLKPQGISLKRLDFDFEEGRELNIEAVTLIKLQQAKNQFPDKKIIVNDTGFFIPALNGFPGPFIKLLLDSFSYEGLIKLMVGESDRRAVFSSAVGYFDGLKDHIFVADEVGYITDKPKGSNLHGWTDILYVFGHPSFPGKSLAELNDIQWDEYLKAIEDVDPFALLAEHLKSEK